MLTNETIVSFREAVERLPRINGRRIHVSSLWRWATQGIRGIRLESRRLGGRFVTSLEALDRFSQRLAEDDTPGDHMNTADTSEWADVTAVTGNE